MDRPKSSASHNLRQRLRVRAAPDSPPPCKVVIGLLLLGWMSGPALAQDGEDTRARFVKFLGSPAYTQLIAKQALDNDSYMPPKCNSRQVVRRRFIYLFRRPAFLATRDVPIAGEWLVRVTVRRCGRAVDHNLFVKASHVRGLVVQPGYPGNTLTLPADQIRVGKALIKRTLRAQRGCRRVDVINTRVTAPPRGAPRWTETWTVWACGRRLTYRIGFSRQGGGQTTFRIR